MHVFNLGRSPKVRGAGHVVLNALRAFTIIGLVSVMASCWTMIVMSGITGHFDFFDTITHFFIFAISVFLVVSETELFKNYFHNTWPVLGPLHSLAWLGLASVIMGCSLLGDLVKPAYAADNLGLPLWRLVLASGILAITFGVFNMVCSVIFRDSESGITARQIRTHGNLAPAKKESSAYDSNSYTSYAPRDNFSQRSASLRQRDEEEPRPSAAKRITRMLNPKNMNFRKSKISAPVYVEPQFPRELQRDLEHGDDYDDRASPIIPSVQRPPTALHPLNRGRDRSRDSSHYSVANMTQFGGEKI